MKTQGQNPQGDVPGLNTFHFETQSSINSFPDRCFGIPAVERPEADASLAKGVDETGASLLGILGGSHFTAMVEPPSNMTGSLSPADTASLFQSAHLLLSDS